MSPRDGDTSDLSAPSAGHGPYCCEGSGCPREDEYATKEYNCLMPASSMLGVPRCANLIGSPLPNLALASAGAKASLSSEYPYTENAGVGAAIDGRLDGKYFHTRCDGHPQWFNLTFPSPIAIEQIAIHNRPLRTNDLLYRFVGSTVRLYGSRDAAGAVPNAGTTTISHKEPAAIRSLRVNVAREMYVWTLQPPVQDVSYLTVHLGERVLPPGSACLHFSEIEVFGTPQSDFDPSTPVLSRRVPETPPPPPSPSSSSSNARQLAAVAEPSTFLGWPTSRTVSIDAKAHTLRHADTESSMPTGASTRTSASGASARPIAGHGQIGGGGGHGSDASADSRRGQPRQGASAPPKSEVMREYTSWLHAACACTATAAVLLGMQVLWIKTTWMDKWN
mmetsp:Transcript_12705/g.38825  ORF Transcript_12705/g.38825 Transcript_12705/m.38825 type:complete len:392 (-) Transcript_12705:252-1427(-)